ncbi:MAG: hypothetical protein WBD40_24445 [Tepidisphaeraceae bacterium]
MELPERNGATRTLVRETKRCDRMADGVYHVGVYFVDEGAAAPLPN